MGLTDYKEKVEKANQKIEKVETLTRERNKLIALTHKVEHLVILGDNGAILTDYLPKHKIALAVLDVFNKELESMGVQFE